MVNYVAGAVLNALQTSSHSIPPATLGQLLKVPQFHDIQSTSLLVANMSTIFWRVEKNRGTWQKEEIPIKDCHSATRQRAFHNENMSHYKCGLNSSLPLPFWTSRQLPRVSWVTCPTSLRRLPQPTCTLCADLRLTRVMLHKWDQLPLLLPPPLHR